MIMLLILYMSYDMCFSGPFVDDLMIKIAIQNIPKLEMTLIYANLVNFEVYHIFYIINNLRLNHNKLKN